MGKSVVIKDEIAELRSQLKALEEQLKTTFEVGKIYRKINYSESLYTILDFDGEIRFLNITNSHFWRTSIRSCNTDYKLQGGGNQKVQYLTYEEFDQLTNGLADKFYIEKD